MSAAPALRSLVLLSLLGALGGGSPAYAATLDETVAALRPIADRPVSRDEKKGREIRVSIDKIIGQWDGIATVDGLHQALSALDASPASVKIISWMLQDHKTDTKTKGDLLAHHILHPRDDEQRRLLTLFAFPEHAEASLLLREALVTELDDEVKVGIVEEPLHEALPTNYRAYNLLMHYVESQGFIKERNIMELSHGSGEDVGREWMAKLRAVIAAHPGHFRASKARRAATQ